MSVIENRLKELGITLPNSPQPMANYVSGQRAGNLLFFSGAGPMKDGKPTILGRLGEDVSIKEGQEAAREAAINLIATLKQEVGDLDRVEQIVKILAFVASSDDFHQQPTVINGASDLFVQVFGDRGRHARSAVGVNTLPFNIPVEVEMIVLIKED